MESRCLVVILFIFSTVLSCNKQPDKKELPVVNLNSISAINDSINPFEILQNCFLQTARE
jgi:hypothetical protein